MQTEVLVYSTAISFATTNLWNWAAQIKSAPANLGKSKSLLFSVNSKLLQHTRLLFFPPLYSDLDFFLYRWTSELWGGELLLPYGFHLWGKYLGVFVTRGRNSRSVHCTHAQRWSVAFTFEKIKNPRSSSSPAHYGCIKKESVGWISESKRDSNVFTQYLMNTNYLKARESQGSTFFFYMLSFLLFFLLLRYTEASSYRQLSRPIIGVEAGYWTQLVWGFDHVHTSNFSTNWLSARLSLGKTV